MILRVVRADDRLRRAERGEHGLVALAPVEDVGLGDGVGLDAADLGRHAVDQARVGAHARHDLGHRRGGECVTRSGDERRVPVERRHDVVGRDLLLDRFAIGRLHPVRERRDERDERDPDHQRRRGRRRPARVPAGVLAARASGHAIRDHAGELHRPLRLPRRQRPSQPHDEDDRQEQRVEERAADEGEDAARSRSRPPRSVALEPVREEEERPEQDGEDERGPAADRAADHGERTHDVLREHRDTEEQQEDAGPRSRAGDRPCRARP